MNSRKLTREELTALLEIVLNQTVTHSYLRFGQSFFNNLVGLHPEFEWIRTTEFDPFYQNNVLLKLIPRIASEEALEFWNTCNLKLSLEKAG